MRVAKFLYEPRKQFIPFHKRAARWSVIVAHRRAGKTVAAVNDLIVGALECRSPRPRFAYIAPFLKQAKMIAWDYMKHYAQPFAAGKPNESELFIPMPNGGRILVLGADNADALRGTYLDGVILDEFGDFRPSVYGNVIRPTLSDRLGWVVFAGTPKGRNEFWKRREEARKNPHEWLLLEMRADETEIIDAEELKKAREQLTPEQYAQEYECDFAAALPGAYFGRELVEAERSGRIRAVAHDVAAPVYTSWDIGRRDDTAIWFYQIIANEIHLIDFFSASGHDPASAAAQILGRAVKIDIVGDAVVAEVGDVLPELAHRTRYEYATHWLPHDARAKTFAAKGKSTIQQLAAVLGMDHMKVVPNLSVQDGINAARMTLARCWFDDKRCGDGVESLRQYQREYDDEKKAFRERPRHDWTSHPADAFRMMAVAWRHESAPEEKPRGKMLHEVTLDELYDADEQRASLERRI